MANERCTNELCVNKETQLRLARLREELLTNFNTLLIDRIRFLEQTINRLAGISPSTATESPSTLTDKHLSPAAMKNDRLTAPSPLRRSSSTTAYLLQSPSTYNLIAAGPNARSCPSSVDLSNNNEQRKWFLSVQKHLRIQDRTSSEFNSHYLSLPMHRQWARSTNDLVSSTIGSSDKGRLESRRFACDVDDNDVRAFKAMIYMERARKQHARPLTRLRQALGISSNSNTGSSTLNSAKKQTNA